MPPLESVSPISDLLRPRLLLEALAARTVDALVRTANCAAKGRDWSIVAACLHVCLPSRVQQSVQREGSYPPTE